MLMLTSLTMAADAAGASGTIGPRRPLGRETHLRCGYYLRVTVPHAKSNGAKTKDSRGGQDSARAWIHDNLADVLI